MPGLLDLVLQQSNLPDAGDPQEPPAPAQRPQTPEESRRLPTFYDAVIRQSDGSASNYGSLALARANASEETPSVLRAVAGRLPFIRSAFDWGAALMSDRSQARIVQNQGTPDDFARVATHERMQQIRADRTPGENLYETLMDTPAMAAEALTAGRLISAGAAASPTFGGLVQAAPGASLAARAGAFAGQSTATAALMGNWAPRWAENNQSRGRPALDLRGLPPAFGHEVATMAVLGSLGHFGDSIGANNIGGFLQRGLARVGLGMTEQAGLDVATSAVQNSVQSVFHYDLGLDAGYGLVGQLARGEGSAALANATQQALTFTVFAGMHEAQRTPVMREYSASMRDLRREGLSAETAGRRMSDVTSLMQGAVERDLTRSEARTLLEASPIEGAARRYGEGLLRTIPEEGRGSRALLNQPNRQFSLSDMTGSSAERLGPPTPESTKPTGNVATGPSPVKPGIEPPNPVQVAADRLSKSETALRSVTDKLAELKTKKVPVGDPRYDPIFAEQKRLFAESQANRAALSAEMAKNRPAKPSEPAKGSSEPQKAPKAAEVTPAPAKPASEPSAAPKGSWNSTGTRFREVGEGLQFTGRNGQTYHMAEHFIQPGERPSAPHGGVILRVHDEAGKEVAHVGMFRNEKGNWQGEGLHVEPGHRDTKEQRAGIGAAMYDYIASQGGHVIPSEGQTPAGKKFWQRNQESKGGNVSSEAKSPTPKPKQSVEAMRSAFGLIDRIDRTGSMPSKVTPELAALGQRLGVNVDASMRPQEAVAKITDAFWSHPHAEAIAALTQLGQEARQNRSREAPAEIASTPAKAEEMHPDRVMDFRLKKLSYLLEQQSTKPEYSVNLARTLIGTERMAKDRGIDIHDVLKEKLPELAAAIEKPELHNLIEAAREVMANVKESLESGGKLGLTEAEIYRQLAQVRGEPVVVPAASQQNQGQAGPAPTAGGSPEAVGGTVPHLQSPTVPVGAAAHASDVTEMREQMRRQADPNFVPSELKYTKPTGRPSLVRPSEAPLTSIQKATLGRMKDPAQREFAKQNFQRSNQGAKTLYDAIVSTGGITPESVTSAGLDLKSLRETFPAKLFSKKGIPLDDITDQGSFTREIWGNREQMPEDKSHRADDFFQKLAEHYLLEPGNWFEHQQYQHDLTQLREGIHEQLQSSGLGGAALEAAVDAEVARRLDGVNRKADEANTKPHETGDADESDASGGFGTADPTDPTTGSGFDPSTFGRPVSPGERGQLPGGGQENAQPGGLPPKPTAAIANAHIDAWRENQGLTPILSDARRADPVVWDRAMARLTEDPMAASKLVEEIVAKPRSTSAEENALLLQRTVAVRNERTRNMIELVDAYTQRVREGGRNSVTPETAARIAQLENGERDLATMVDRTDKASRLSGSEWGRAGRWRRMLVADDYTLAGMLRSAEAAKGRPLTEAERTELTALNEKIADLQKKLDEAEASGKVKPGAASDEGFAVDQARKVFQTQLTRDKASNAPWQVKALRLGGEVVNLPRAIMASIDFPLLRQGMLAMASHPVRTMRAVPEMLRSFMSDEVASRAEYELQHRPNSPLYEKAGLDLATREGGIASREEGFLSRMMGQDAIEAMKKANPKLGVIAQVLTAVPRASERSYLTVLNRIRADSFDAMAASLSKKGALTDSEAKVIANYVNVMTGRGPLGAKGEKAALLLNSVFFAPRWTVSRFQFVAGQPLWGNFGESAPRARALVAKEYAKVLSGLGVALGLAAGFGFQVVTDPRSSAFGQLQAGNTFIDLTGGLRRPTTLISRLWSGKRVDSFGVPHPIRGNVPFGQPTAVDMVGNYMRSSLAPAPGAALNLAAGSNLGGQPATLPGELQNLTTPLFARDVYDAVKDLGVPQGTAISLLALMGLSMQTRTNEPRPARPVTADSRRETVLRGQIQHLTDAIRGQRHENGRTIHGPAPSPEQRAIIQRQIDRLVGQLP